MVAITLVDQDPATTRSLGILNVSLGLVAGLAELAAEGQLRLVVLAHEGLRERLPEAGPGVAIRWWPEPPLRWNRVAWDLWGVASALRTTAADAHVFPKGFLPLRSTGAPTFALVHDLIFDFYRARGWRFGGPRQSFFATLQRSTLRRADHVLTTTRAVAAEVSRLRSAAVTPLGVGPTSPPMDPVPAATPPPASAPVVFLASPLPHKRTADLVGWLKHWHATSAQPRPIVGIGRLPDGVTLPDDPSWTLHQRLPQDRYRDLLRSAAILVYTSAYEGFGLPPREALSAGVRALASDIPVHREHLPAEILFGGNDAPAFAHHLDALLASAPPPLPWPSPSWHTVAERLLRVIHETSGRVEPDGPSTR